MKERKKIHSQLERKNPTSYYVKCCQILSNSIYSCLVLLLIQVMYLILKQLNIEYILYQILNKELLTSAVIFCCSKSVFEWLTNLPIKRHDLEFGSVLKNYLKQKKQLNKSVALQANNYWCFPSIPFRIFLTTFGFF